MSVNRPAWSYPERKPKPHVQSGLRFVGGAKCWCYLCNQEHPWGAECGASMPSSAHTQHYENEPVPCTVCQTWFRPSPFARGQHRYCSPACKQAVKNAKRSVSYDGRYD